MQRIETTLRPEPMEILQDESDLNAIRQMRHEKAKLWPECDRFSDVGIVFQDEYIRVVRDPVRFPTGKKGTYLRIFEHAGLDGRPGVVVLPSWREFVVFIEIFRHATRSWEIELPRGWRNPDEEPLVAAIRELAEETHLLGVESIHLGTIHPNSGILAVADDVFFVRCADQPNRPLNRNDEASASTRLVRLSELDALLASDQIHDALSLSALMLARTKGILRW